MAEALVFAAKAGADPARVRQALLGEEIQLFGDGSQRRDFNHVSDVVDAFLRAGLLLGDQATRAALIEQVPAAIEQRYRDY